MIYLVPDSCPVPDSFPQCLGQRAHAAQTIAAKAEQAQGSLAQEVQGGEGEQSKHILLLIYLYCDI